MYEPGALLMGKYRVDRTIGRGGMGTVVAAEHIELRTQVALKFLADKFVQRADVVERFIREARACAQLRSDHICRVSDVGRLENGVPYFVMELLAGSDLAQLLRKRGPVEVAVAADYIHQACDAVAEAHAAQIIHRDLKPANLFLTQRRDGGALIKVLDFGVAKAKSEDDFALTGMDAVMGSPSYMAPEQLRGARHADARSDIWSLGVILHELLVGKAPFHGETIAELAIKITIDPLPPLVGIPPILASIIARCLDKDPDRRFQTVDELASVLEPFTPPREIRASGPRMVGPITLPLAPTLQMTAVHGNLDHTVAPPASTTLRSASGIALPAADPPSSNRRWIVIGAVAAVLIGVGAGVIVDTSRSGGESSRTATQPTPAPVATPDPVVPAAPVAAPPAMAPPVVVAPAIDAGVVAPAIPPPAVDAAVAPAIPVAVPAPPPVVTPPADTPAKAKPVHKVKAKSKDEVGESRI